jgi:DNA-binding NtrC family response regulator
MEPDPLAVCDVLLVEDDIDLGDAIASSLKRRGLDVRTVPSASSALGVLQRVRPRVAVLDHNLPGESGLALAERIHRILPDLPIILMSGGAVEQDRQALEKVGIRVFVNKPVPISALHQAILRFIQKAG